MNIQIRLRVPEWSRVIELVGDYIQKADRSFSFHHDISGNNHYHIYLFDIDVQSQSIRKKLGHYLPKTNYMVSEKCKQDKQDITPRKAYQYGTTKDIIAPIHYHGYEEEDLLVFKEQAELYYELMGETKKEKIKGDTKEIHIVEYQQFKMDKSWERLKEQEEIYKDKSVKQIKSMICAEWLNAGRAIPRPSDLHRYAISLFYRQKYMNKDHNYEVPDYALENEYN